MASTAHASIEQLDGVGIEILQGKADDAMTACAIFSGKQVDAKRWCSAYVKKRETIQLNTTRSSRNRNA
ncbi:MULTISPECIES: high-potential iron-sulfur protein [Paraburkholderia]|uniref:High potential iron-sulfur proteins family profile domain-containing protein n=1 Tax=Paraburkholderia nemoris TaxID=2793076 RepID=A0ABM8QYS6_9BURK|nr:hypothetical protein [Paraburkholderia aspalathi]CAE6723098.1 hypothetical protein R69776_01627 [Paraburkholderia nemoris]CAE6749981.1 hypothetical protein R75777_02942 [Paraburkholderia nemoris]